MIKMSEGDTQKFEQDWNEVRECYFLIKRRKAKIVVTRGKDGKEYRYTKPLRAAGFSKAAGRRN